MDEIYDREFFLPYSVQSKEYERACHLIAQEIYQRIEPATVVDWGCGTGLYAAALKACGAQVVGVDGVLADADLRPPEVDIVVGDMCGDSVELPWDTYDLALCLDVLEHIPEEGSASALANIVRGAKTVILSCAPPGQGGHHHVNEQPRRYWVKRMADLGWQYQRRATGALENHFLTMRDRLPWSWMYHNICIYTPVGR